MPGFISEPIANPVGEAQGFADIPSAPFQGQQWLAPERWVGAAVRYSSAMDGTVDPETGVQLTPPEPRMPAADLQAKYGVPAAFGVSPLTFTSDLPESVASEMHDAKMAEQRRADAAARTPDGIMAGVSRFGAGMATQLLDPIGAASMMVPMGGEVRGVGMLARAGSALTRGAAAGAAVTTPFVALHKLYADEYGEDYSAGDALREILMGGALGGGLHAGATVAGDVIGHAFQGSSAQAIVDADPDIRYAAASEAVSAALDDRPPQSQSVIDLAAAVQQPNPAATPRAPIDGDASPFTMVRPSDLQLDPQRFQYKEADDRGVTGALAGANRWEPALANPITAYRDTDGGLYVVNGHQRTDLALRAEAAGQDDIRVPARVYDAADGWTPAMMRTLGAFQNIAEGSGTAIDAAKVMRSLADMPDAMKLPELPPKSILLQQARGLSRLSDDAFGTVVNGVVPPAYAAEVGRALHDPREQMAAIDLLRRAEPANVEQARLMVHDIRENGFMEGSQDTLFGHEAFSKSLVPGRAKVLGQGLQTLRGNTRVFKAAVEGEPALAGAGNQMDRAANVEGKTENERLIEILQRSATKRGPLSDALSDAARAVDGGKRISHAAADFLTAARDIIRSGQAEGLERGPDIDGAGPALHGDAATEGLAAGPSEGAEPGLFGEAEARPQSPLDARGAAIDISNALRRQAADAHAAPEDAAAIRAATEASQRAGSPAKIDDGEIGELHDALRRAGDAGLLDDDGRAALDGIKADAETTQGWINALPQAAACILRSVL